MYALIAWESTECGITKTMNISIAQYQATSETSNIEAKEVFREQLIGFQKGFPKSYPNADLNASMDFDNTSLAHMMCKDILATMTVRRLWISVASDPYHWWKTV